MRAPVLAGVVVLFAGCGPLNYRGESWQEYYPQPYDETSTKNVERKIILHWTKDPKQKERIGYLERYEVILQGARIPREYYIIKDRRGLQELGYVSEDGKFFRYNRDGTMSPIGEYAVIDTGVKVFFGLPLDHNLGFEEIDPYRD